MKAVIQRIRQTIERHRMIRAGQAVGVAVSGGADSVCLLHVLVELAPLWDLRLHVLHLDHGLRGEESRQDVEFVAGLAERLGLPFHLRQADLATQGGNLEQAGRQARLRFFRELIESGAVDKIAVGHTRSDQAETVLFRFLRGSGTAGLAAIRPVTGSRIVRPLLEVDRAEVEEFLRERAIPWRNDSTNSSPQFARNRIRHALLPQLARDWNPAIGETLAHTAEWAQAEEDYWKSEIDQLAAKHLLVDREAVILHAPALAGLPVAVGRRLLRRAIGLAKGDTRRVDFHHIQSALALAARPEGTGILQIPGLELRRSFDLLRLGKPQPPLPYRMAANVPCWLQLPGPGGSICLELLEKPETSDPGEYVYNDGMGRLDWCSLSGSLELRNWRPGDQYRPVGSTGGEKIKTLFQHARIPVWERPLWPVLLDGESIVWTRRFGPAAEHAANLSTRVILTVRETATGE